MLKLVTLPEVKDIKTDLFMYAVNGTSLSDPKKFQCEDLHKKDVAYKRDQDLIVLVANKKSKDGRDFVGKAVNGTDNAKKNYIYMAYMAGKTDSPPLKEFVISLMNFFKCLLDHGISLLNISIEHTDFSEEIDVAMALLLLHWVFDKERGLRFLQAQIDEV